MARPAARVAVVVGTRPEAIKTAPLVLELRERGALDCLLIDTGQHRQLLDQALGAFGLAADLDLGLERRPRDRLAAFTGRMVSALDQALEELRPDALVVQGDTATSLAGIIAGFYRGTRIVHLEAGLRSGRLDAPFPEEFNRRVAAFGASLHLAATAEAERNLLVEGVPARDIVVTGNTVVDAVRRIASCRIAWDDPRLEPLDRDPRRVLLVTMHRRESWGHRMEMVGEAVAKLAAAHDDMLVAVVSHANLAAQEALVERLDGQHGVLVLGPQSYGSFVKLMQRSHLILSDSGGIQEEGPSLGKPVLVLREVTERAEALAAGANRLVGMDPEHIVQGVTELWTNEAAYLRMSRAVNPYGDGFAAARCAEAIEERFGGAAERVSAAAGSRAGWGR